MPDPIKPAPVTKDLGNKAASDAIAKMNEALKANPGVKTVPEAPVKQESKKQDLGHDLVNKAIVEMHKALATVSSKGLVHKRIQEIEHEFGLKVSEIPLNHEYWALLNQYRGMR